MGMLVNSAGVWKDILDTTGGGTGIEEISVTKTSGSGSGNVYCYKSGNLCMVILNNFRNNSLFSGFPKPLREISDKWCTYASIYAPTLSGAGAGISDYVYNVSFSVSFASYTLSINGDLTLQTDGGITTSSHFMYLTSE